MTVPVDWPSIGEARFFISTIDGKTITIETIEHSAMTPGQLFATADHSGCITANEIKAGKVAGVIAIPLSSVVAIREAPRPGPQRKGRRPGQAVKPRKGKT